VCYLPEKKTTLPGFPAVACRVALEIYQGQPPTMYSECSSFHPDRFNFGGNSRTREHRQKRAIKRLQYPAEAYAVRYDTIYLGLRVLKS